MDVGQSSKQEQKTYLVTQAISLAGGLGLMLENGEKSLECEGVYVCFSLLCLLNGIVPLILFAQNNGPLCSMNQSWILRIIFFVLDVSFLSRHLP